MNLYPKRLIEVDLPIKRISAHARREKSIRHGHISTLHHLVGAATAGRAVLHEPFKDPACFPWHEVMKVQHYWLEVNALTKPMQIREDRSAYAA